MSFSELETLVHLNELEHKQTLQTLALDVLKKPDKGYLLSSNRPNFLDNEGTFHILWYYTCTRKNLTTLCI